MIRNGKKGLEGIHTEEVAGSIPASPISIFKGLQSLIKTDCNRL